MPVVTRCAVLLFRPREEAGPGRGGGVVLKGGCAGAVARAGGLNADASAQPTFSSLSLPHSLSLRFPARCPLPSLPFGGPEVPEHGAIERAYLSPAAPFPQPA